MDKPTKGQFTGERKRTKVDARRMKLGAAPSVRSAVGLNQAVSEGDRTTYAPADMPYKSRSVPPSRLSTDQAFYCLNRP